MVGLIVKPVSGTFDLISHTTEGVKNSAKSKDAFVDWCWFPWPFYNTQNLFKAYNERDAYVIGVLRKLDAIDDSAIFKASFKVSSEPEHVIAIFMYSLYKIKIKIDKLGSVKRAFTYK